MNIFKIIYGWFLNDWEPVWADTGKWILHGDLFGDTTENCGWSIEYSTYFNRYRIRTWGHKPKSHPAYHEVVNKLQDWKDWKQKSIH